MSDDGTTGGKALSQEGAYHIAWRSQEGMTSQIGSTHLQLYPILVAAAALVVNAWFSWKSYKHNRVSRNISATNRLLEQWRSPEMTKAERFVLFELHSKCPNLRYEDLTPEDATLPRNISNLCDEIAMRVIFEEADGAVVLTSIGDQVSKLWEVLSPLIHAERIKRDFPAYMAYFEALAKKARTADLVSIRIKRTSAFLNHKF